ncbi:hypothetical protein NBRC116599_43600 [Aquicoccus sp. SU-CL01552]
MPMRPTNLPSLMGGGRLVGHIGGLPPANPAEIRDGVPVGANGSTDRRLPARQGQNQTGPYRGASVEILALSCRTQSNGERWPWRV